MGGVVMKGRFSRSRITQTLGTEIVQLVKPSMRGGRAIITNVDYVCGGTAHTLTVMKALARTTASAAAAASQAVLNFTSVSFLNQTIAANDFCVVQHTDGTFGIYKVSSVSSLAVTFGTNLTAAVAANSPIWIMGATGEAEHKSTLVIASVRNVFSDAFAGWAQSGFDPVTYGSTLYSRSGIDDPVIIHSNNATAAGFLENVSGYYASV